MMTRSHGIGGRAVLMCLLLIGVMLLIPACSETTQGTHGARYTRQAAGPSAINWDRLTTQARDEHRSVYLLFTAPWCPNCRRFEQNTLPDQEVRRALNEVIYVRASVDREKALSDQYGVTGVPTGVLLKYRGGQLREVDKHVGGLGPAKLVRFLRQ